MMLTYCMKKHLLHIAFNFSTVIQCIYIHTHTTTTTTTSVRPTQSFYVNNFHFTFIVYSPMLSMLR